MKELTKGKLMKNVVDEIMNLYRQGYDGPLMGDDTEAVMRACVALDAGGYETDPSMDSFDRLVAEFTSREAAADILEIYVKLHEKKLFMHWLWALVERVAAGEPIEQVMKDYGYVKEKKSDG